MSLSRSVALVAIWLSVAVPVQAGSFLDADDPGEAPFVIVHPRGYTGAGGPLTLDICIEASSRTVEPALEAAMKLWNDLVPAALNCSECPLWEEAVQDETAPHSMNSVLLHELGHCALGLGHPNLATSSFTNTTNHTSIDDGGDDIRGSFDDSPSPLPGARLIHWFRIADNDPVALDATVIDSSTYSRRLLDLPSGHGWPANANRLVAAAGGFPDTHSVMYDSIAPGQRFLALTADDVTTVRFAMAGLDETAGTADDYTVHLARVDDCASADIQVELVPLGGDPSTNSALGVCIAEIARIDPGNTVHHAVDNFGLPGPLRLQIRSDGVRWDVLFVDGFETGDASRWAASSPP